MVYANPLEEYLALMSGAAGNGAPGGPGLPGTGGGPGVPGGPGSSAGLAFVTPDGGNPYAAASALAPYQEALQVYTPAPISQDDWGVLGQTYGFEPPAAAPAQSQGREAPPLDTSIPVAEPSAPPRGPPARSARGGGEGALPPQYQAMEDVYAQGRQQDREQAEREGDLFRQRGEVIERLAVEEGLKRQEEGDYLKGLQADIAQKQAELNRPDPKLDQGRWWREQSTAHNIFTGLALGFGSLSSGLAAARTGEAGRNLGLEYITNSIDRDLDIQREEIAGDRQRRAGAVAGAQNLYGLARQSVSDDQAARQLARSYALDIVANQADALAAESTHQQQQQHYAEQGANLRILAQKDKEEAQQRQFQRWNADRTFRLQERQVAAEEDRNWIQGETAKAKAEAEAKGERDKAQEKQDEKTVPGVGVATTAGAAKEVQERTAAFRQFDSDLDAQIKRAKERAGWHGVSWDTVSPMTSDNEIALGTGHSNLSASYGKAKGLGSFDNGTQALIEGMIGNNATPRTAWETTRYLQKLEALRQTARQGYVNSLRPYLVQPAPELTSLTDPKGATQQGVAKFGARPR